MLIDKIAYILPMLIMVESLLAVVPFLVATRYGSAIYWFSVALITFAVTWLIPKLG